MDSESREKLKAAISVSVDPESKDWILDRIKKKKGTFNFVMTNGMEVFVSYKKHPLIKNENGLRENDISQEGDLDVGDRGLSIAYWPHHKKDPTMDTEVLQEKISEVLLSLAEQSKEDHD